MRVIIGLFIAICCGCSGCGILDANVQSVPLEQIDGYYKVLQQRIVKNNQLIKLTRGPYIFPDTTVDTFFTDWIHIQGNKAESVGYYHMLRGSDPNWEYHYNYSMRAVANITWRLSERKDTWVGQYNWKLVNADGAVLNTEINYISHDGFSNNRMTVVYCDNATRMVDPYIGEDPIILVEVWIKVDSSEYNHWYRKARFY